MTRFLSLIFLCGTLLSWPLAAQPFEKGFEVAEKYFENGEYRKALDQCNKVLEKLEKANKGLVVAKGNLLKAKYLEALGDYGQFEDLVAKTLERKKYKGDNTLLYAKGLLDVAMLYLAYSDIRTVETYFQKASAILPLLFNDRDGNPAPGNNLLQQARQDLFFEDRLRYLEIKILQHQGYYQEALGKIEALRQIRYQRLAPREMQFNEASNKLEERRLTRHEQQCRKREYAEVFTLKADLHRLYGQYFLAEDALDDARFEIKIHLHKKDPAYIAMQHVNSLLLADQKVPEDQVRKSLEKNLFLAERRLGLVHKQFLAIHESLIDHYIRHFNKRSKVQQWELRVNTQKYFGKETLPHVVSERLDAKKNYYQKNYDAAYKSLYALYTKPGRVPQNHQERTKLLEQLYEVSLAMENYFDAKKYLDEWQQTTAALYGTQSVAHHQVVMKKAAFFQQYTSQFAYADSLMRGSFYGLIIDRIDQGHNDYSQYLNQFADFYLLTGNYQAARENTRKILEISKGRFGEQHVEYAIGLSKMTDVDLHTGHYQSADQQIGQMLEIFRKQQQKKVQAYAYAQALEVAARYYATMGLFEEAKGMLARSSRLYNHSVNARTNSTAVDELVNLYIRTERYKQAGALVEEALQARKIRYGDSSRFVVTPYNQLAQLAFAQGDYVMAEAYAQKALGLGESNFGPKAHQLVASLNTLADLKTAMGDVEGAEELLQRVLEIQQHVLGGGHIETAATLTRMAQLNRLAGEEAAKAESLMLKARDIVSQNLGTDNPIYAHTLKKLSSVYIARGKFEEALQALDQARQIWNQKLGTTAHTHAAEILLLKGEIALRKGEFAQSVAYFKQSKKLYQKIFNTTHPMYVQAMAYQGRANYSLGKFNRSKKLTEKVLENYFAYIDQFFPVLSEREKAKYWNLIRMDFEFYHNLAFSGVKGKKMIGQAYDHTMATKSLLLSASIKTRNQILSSGDTTLIAQYNHWTDQKEFLTRALAMSQEQLKDEQIDLKKLAKDIEATEKSLSASSKLFQQENQHRCSQPSWKNVRGMLGKGEVAIEMVRYHHYSRQFTDSVVYAALIVAPNAKRPEWVALPKGNMMETNYLRYYRNTIIYNLDDENSYQYYWKPIDERIPDQAKIYFSADGVYNQINLEAIRHENNGFVLDHSHLVLVSNTADLLKAKGKSEASADSQVAVARQQVVLMGNPVFYKDLAEEEYNRYSRRAISQLPGTYDEVRALEKLIRQVPGMAFETYLLNEATEDRVKMLVNPRVFHVASHGFFWPDETNGAQERSTFSERVSNNPLLKSGILLKGAGDLMADNSLYAFNKAPGVLTAYEVMGLNLDETELVVLSACETGRGENKVGEGVYGLQRAFLVAGAKAVVMSLFKVSDEATRMLMERFYHNWLVNQMDKRAAFAQAKKELRNEYPDPIFWGAFIMVGVE